MQPEHVRDYRKSDNIRTTVGSKCKRVKTRKLSYEKYTTATVPLLRTGRRKQVIKSDWWV